MKLLISLCFTFCLLPVFAFANDFDDAVNYVSEENFEQALVLFKKEADRGNTMAQTIVGTFYLKGLSVEQDSHRAVKWLKKAAKNNVDAQAELGRIYQNGIGNIEIDHKKSAYWYRKELNSYEEIAQKGNVDMQFHTGFKYYYGMPAVGIEPNKKKAKEYFDLACNNGDQRSCDFEEVIVE